MKQTVYVKLWSIETPDKYTNCKVDCDPNGMIVVRTKSNLVVAMYPKESVASVIMKYETDDGCPIEER